MLILPIETPDHSADALVVVLDGGNLERMIAADPAEVILRQTGWTLVNPTVLVCYERDTPEFTRLLQGRDVGAILAFLRRGFEFRPDKGDRGPERIGEHN